MLASLSRSFRMASLAPTFKAFNIALIQLGGVTDNKADNLKHAHKMILRAAGGEGGSKPNVIVLPVCIDPDHVHACSYHLLGMFQFTLWPCSLSKLCREDCIHAQRAV
jgi:hypothetical protein